MRHEIGVMAGVSAIALAGFFVATGDGHAAQSQAPGKGSIQVIKPKDKPGPVSTPKPGSRIDAPILTDRVKPGNLGAPAKKDQYKRPGDVRTDLPKGTGTISAAEARRAMEEKARKERQEAADRKAWEDAQKAVETCLKGGGLYRVTVQVARMEVGGDDVDDVYGYIDTWLETANQSYVDVLSNPTFGSWKRSYLWHSDGHNFERKVPPRLQTVYWSAPSYSENRRQSVTFQHRGATRTVLTKPTYDEKLYINFRVKDRDRGPFSGADDQFYLSTADRRVVKYKDNKRSTQAVYGFRMPSCQTQPIYRKSDAITLVATTNEKQFSAMTLRLNILIERRPGLYMSTR